MKDFVVEQKKRAQQNKRKKQNLDKFDGFDVDPDTEKTNCFCDYSPKVGQYSTTIIQKSRYIPPVEETSQISFYERKFRFDQSICYDESAKALNRNFTLTLTRHWSLLLTHNGKNHCSKSRMKKIEQLVPLHEKFYSREINNEKRRTEAVRYSSNQVKRVHYNSKEMRILGAKFEELAVSERRRKRRETLKVSPLPKSPYVEREDEILQFDLEKEDDFVLSEGEESVTQLVSGTDKIVEVQSQSFGEIVGSSSRVPTSGFELVQTMTLAGAKLWLATSVAQHFESFTAVMGSVPTHLMLSVIHIIDLVLSRAPTRHVVEAWYIMIGEITRYQKLSHHFLYATCKDMFYLYQWVQVQALGETSEKEGWAQFVEMFMKSELRSRFDKVVRVLLTACLVDLKATGILSNFIGFLSAYDRYGSVNDFRKMGKDEKELPGIRMVEVVMEVGSFAKFVAEKAWSYVKIGNEVDFLSPEVGLGTLVAEFHELSRVMRLSEHLLFSGNADHSLPGYFEYSTRLTRAVIDVEAYMLRETQRGTGSIGLERLREQFLSLQLEFLVTVVGNRMRPAPFVILLHSEPKVGKSAIYPLLYRAVMEEYNIPVEDILVYHRNTEDDFWSNLTSKHNVIVIDDLIAKITEFDKGKSLGELVALINNIPLLTNQADLAKKGKVVALPVIVLLSTNTRSLLAELVYNCPSAVMRRMDLVVSPIVKEEFRRLPDVNALERPMKPDGNFIPDHHYFKIEKDLMSINPDTKNPDTDTVLLSERATRSELIKIVREFAYNHALNQDNFLRSVRNVRAAAFCEHGILAQDCDKCTAIVQSNGTCEHMLDASMCEDCRHKAITDGNPKEYSSLNLSDPWYVRHSSDIFWFYFANIMLALYFPSSYSSIAFGVLVASCCVILGTVVNIHITGVAYVKGVKRRAGKWVAVFKLKTLVTLPRWAQDKLVSPREFTNMLIEDTRNKSLYMRQRFATLSNFDMIKMAAAASAIVSTAVLVKKCLLKEAEGDSTPEVIANSDGIQEAQAKMTAGPNVWRKKHLSSTGIYGSAKSRTTSPSDLIRYTYSCICSLRIFGGNRVKPVVGMLVRGNIILTVGHVFKDLDVEKYRVEAYFLPKAKSSKKAVKFEFNLERSELVLHETLDLAIFGGAFPPRRGLYDLFLPSGEIDPYGTATRVGLPIVNSRPVVKRDENFSYARGPRQISGPGADYVLSDAISFAAENADGFCGCPLLFASRGASFIGALHVGGRGTESVAMSFSRIHIDEMLDCIEGVTVQSRGIDLHSELEIVKSPLQELYRMSNLQFLEDPVNLEIYGTLPQRTISFSSRVKELYFCGKFFPNELEAPEFKGRFLNGVWVSPWRNDLLKLNNIPDAFSNSELQPCVQSVLQRAEVAPVRPTIFGPLSWFHSYNGISGVKHIESMNMSTGSGMFLNGKKSSFFEQVMIDGELKYSALPDTQYQVECFDNRIRGDDMQPLWVFQTCLKDEPITKVKNSEGRVRVFSVSNFYYCVLYRKYFLPVFKFIQDNPLVFGNAVGINVYSSAWKEFYVHLTHFGVDRLVAGDYSKFDKRISWRVLLFAYATLIEIAKRFLQYSKDDVKAMWSLAWSAVFPVYSMQSDIFSVCGSNPSGLPGTVVVNWLVNLFYLMTCFREFYPTKDFWKNVNLMIYGDDNIFGVSKECQNYSHCNISEWMAKRGIRYTTDKKTDEKVFFKHIDDVTFLKRTWRPLKDTGWMVAPLDVGSLAKQTNISVESKFLNWETQSIEGLKDCLKEAFFHGRDCYDSLREKMMKEIEGTMFEGCKFPDFDSEVEFHRPSFE